MSPSNDWLTEEMNRRERAGIPNLDNVTDPDRIGTFGLEGPSECDCDYAPAGHSEADCWDFASARPVRASA